MTYEWPGLLFLACVIAGAVWVISRVLAFLLWLLERMLGDED
jgi:hypothetical protein